MKKLLAIILCIVMSVLPLSSLAADVADYALEAIANGKELVIDTTASVAPGLLDDAITDLVNIFGIRTHVLGTNAGYELTLSGTPVLNVMAGVGDYAILAATNLLAGKTISVTYQELVDMANTFLNAMLSEMGMTLDELVAYFYVAVDAYEYLQMEADAYVTAFMNDIMEIVMAKAEATEDGAIRIVLNAEDLAAIATDENLIALISGMLSEEEAATVQEMVDAILTPDSGITMTIEFAETETGINVFAQMAAGEEGIDFNLNVGMTEAGMGIDMVLSGGDLNVPAWSMVFNAAMTDELVYEGTLSVNDGEAMQPVMGFDGNIQENLVAMSFNVVNMMSISMQFTENEVSDKLEQQQMDIYVEIAGMDPINVTIAVETEETDTNIAEVITMAMSDVTLAKITSILTPVEPTGFFSALEGEQIDPLQMTDEELNALVETLGNNLMSLVMDAMSLLPESTQAMLMGE